MAKKILIIEDNESYSVILTQKLQSEQYEVTSAKDGEEGIEKAINTLPDLLLIDLLLPKKNGIQVMEELRKNDLTKNIPILILTNLNPDDELLQNIEKNKPAYYLIKPQVTMDELSEKVKSVLPNT